MTTAVRSKHIVFNDRSKQAKATLMRYLTDNMQEFAEETQEHAKRVVPYLTGNLRSNIRIQMAADKKGFRIYTTTKYGGYVELGTVKMPGRSYIGLSIRVKQREFEQRMVRDGKKRDPGKLDG